MQSESEMDVDRFHPWIGVGSDCVAVCSRQLHRHHFRTTTHKTTEVTEQAVRPNVHKLLTSYRFSFKSVIQGFYTVPDVDFLQTLIQLQLQVLFQYWTIEPRLIGSSRVTISVPRLCLL